MHAAAQARHPERAIALRMRGIRRTVPTDVAQDIREAGSRFAARTPPPPMFPRTPRVAFAEFLPWRLCISPVRGTVTGEALADLLFAQRCLALSSSLRFARASGEAWVVSDGAAVALNRCARATLQSFVHRRPVLRMSVDAVIRSAGRSIDAFVRARTRGEHRRAQIRRLYVRRDAVSSVATRVACASTGRARHASSFAALVAAVAFAERTMEDLARLEDDLERGVVNFAAAAIARRGAGRVLSVEDAPRFVTKGMLLTDAAQGLLATAASEFDAAARRIPFVDGALERRFTALRHALGKLSEAYGGKRLDVLFGGLLGPTHA